MNILEEIEKLGTVSADHWARLREILKEMLKETKEKKKK